MAERIPDFCATAGDIQSKPMRKRGLDRLVYFSGAVRGLLLGRSEQAIYRIVGTCCGWKSLPSDFHYVISGLSGEPKSARFLGFSVIKSKVMIRF